MTAQKKKKDKPYIRLEYIEGTGTQYIDSGFNPNPKTTRMTYVCSITDTNLSMGGMFGCRIVPNAITDVSSNIFFNVSGSKKFRLDWVGYQSSDIITENTKIVLDCLDKTVIINGKKFIGDMNKRDIYINIPLYLGTFLDGANPMKPYPHRIHSSEIYDDGTMVRNFIPCYLKTTNEAGMYDLITKEFFTNDGTGEFLVGKDL